MTMLIVAFRNLANVTKSCVPGDPLSHFLSWLYVAYFFILLHRFR